MIKNVLKLLLMCIVTAMLYQSCRSEDLLSTTENNNNNEKRFKAFEEQNGKIQYAQAFRNLYRNYAKLHPQDFTKNTSKNADSIYIDFSYSSQTISYGDTLKVVVFPVRKGKKVINALLARTYKHTSVGYKYLTNDDSIEDIKAAFQTALDNNPISLQKGGIGEVQIQEVILPNNSLPSSVGGPEVSYPPIPEDGDCDSYNNCEDVEDNGGGGTPASAANSNPCGKTKVLLAKQSVQSKIDTLKAQSTLGGEKGVKFKADGTSSSIIEGGPHSVDLGNKTGYEGGYHNHTPKGIPMFSPSDVDHLLGFARAQGNTGNASNAYLGMVAPNGMHYVIRFNGTYSDALPNYSQSDLDKFSKDFRQLEKQLTDTDLYGSKYINSDGKINNLGVETLLFNSLQNMNLSGKVNLQRIEKINSVDIIKSVSLDNNNKPIATSCP